MMTRCVPIPKGSTWLTIGAVSCLGFLALLGIAVSPTAAALGALPNPRVIQFSDRGCLTGSKKR